MTADQCELRCVDVPLAGSLRGGRLDPATAERAAAVAKSPGELTELGTAMVAAVLADREVVA